ncbi:hypothetical protein BLOT_000065 [Blomia tropicalis]|nr:hypothetical protein BLOT_000065 [Blomia tropicalis]
MAINGRKNRQTTSDANVLTHETSGDKIAGINLGLDLIKISAHSIASQFVHFSIEGRVSRCCHHIQLNVCRCVVDVTHLAVTCLSNYTLEWKHQSQSPIIQVSYKLAKTEATIFVVNKAKHLLGSFTKLRKMEKREKSLYLNKTSNNRQISASDNV